MSENPALELQERLQEYANPKTKDWWENYVKDSAPFMGVKMATIRTVLHQWYTEAVEDRYEIPDQVDLALALFDGETTEEKLAGTLFLQEILLPVGGINCPRDLVRFASLFDGGKLYDWNACDWFCVKVLGTLIQENGSPCAERIAQWRKAENLWRARASLVPFVNVAEKSTFYPQIEASCQVLIRRSERFAKTAVGWILREISQHDEPFVRRVVDENIEHFSTESLNNAVKYFDKAAQQRYKKLLKETQRRTRANSG